MSYDVFGPVTTEEHIKVMRQYLVDARRILYNIDEGNTSDQHFACTNVMNKDTEKMLRTLDSAIRQTANMLIELEDGGQVLEASIPNVLTSKNW